MRAASRVALAKLREHEGISASSSAHALTVQAEDLYTIAEFLVGQPQLRRTLGDPSTAPERRAELLAKLLSDKVGAAAIETAKAAVRERWSSPWDLADGLELMANDALFAAAESDGTLDEVEDQLFRFERIMESETALTALLDEPTVQASRRIALLDNVLGNKVGPITKSLLEHAVASERKRGITFAVGDLLDEASNRRGRSVARVLSAVELTDEQQRRLAAALSDIYGRTISVHAAVDTSILGGLVVQVGDEVIDGSVAARLTSVRAALAV